MKRTLRILLLGMLVGAAALSLNAAGTIGDKTSDLNSFRAETGGSFRGNYIGEQKAKAIALKNVPGANESHLYKLHLDHEDGRIVYEGEIYYDGWEYEFNIDAVTGEIVKWEKDRD